MSTQYGCTPSGFVRKPLDQIVADYQAAWLANVDPTADLSPGSIEANIIASISAEDDELWGLAEAGYDTFNREAVQGAGLDNLGDLEAIPREGPSYTQVYCDVTLDPSNAPYKAGSLIANVAGSPALTFANFGDVTAAIISGFIAPAILFQATTIGQTPAVAPNTLTAINSPVTGWTAITNPDAQSQLGSNVEIDDAYAGRQVAEIAFAGSGSPEATLAALLELGAELTPADALTCEVLNNTGDTPLTIGSLTLPPHTFAPVVYDPTGQVTDDEIAAVIWRNTPAGIASFGTRSLTYTDPVLGAQTVRYTAPQPLPLFIEVLVALKPNFTIDVVRPAIQSALVAASRAPTPPKGQPPIGQLLPGVPVIGSQLLGVVMSVPGVFDCQALAFDVTPNPRNTAPIPIALTNIATITGENVSVSLGTPP